MDPPFYPVDQSGTYISYKNYSSFMNIFIFSRPNFLLFSTLSLCHFAFFLLYISLRNIFPFIENKLENNNISRKYFFQNRRHENPLFLCFLFVSFQFPKHQYYKFLKKTSTIVLRCTCVCFPIKRFTFYQLDPQNNTKRVFF